MTTPTLDVSVEPAHVAALGELTSTADRVRYACQYGPGPRTDDVRQWLSAYGYKTRRQYVSTLVTAHRAGIGMDDTGDLPLLTAEVLDDLDRSTADEAAAVATPEQVAPSVPTPGVDLVPSVATAVGTQDSKSASTEVRTAAPVGRRRPHAGALAVLALSAAAAIVAGVYAAHTPLSSVQAWNTASLVTAGAGALVVLLALVFSLASVASALVAGRTSRDVALDVASWTVAGIAGFLAAYGQVKFAEWANVHGTERFLVPGILEPAVVVLLLLANRRVKRRREGLPAKPIGKLLLLAAVLGGFAVYTNVVHAPARAGLVFGAATTVGLILWWVKLQDDAAPDDWDDQPQSKRLSRRTSRYRVLRWVILPGQTARAWLISLDHSIEDAEQGLALARRYRRLYDERRDTGAKRGDARRHARREIDSYLTR